MQAGSELGGRVLVVAESGHEPLVRALTAEGHEVETRLPASALGEPPEVVVAVRAPPAPRSSPRSSGANRLPIAPVIVLSGAVPPKERAGLLRAGAHTCLPDPVIPTSCSPRWRARSPSSAAAMPARKSPRGSRTWSPASATAASASASSTSSSRARPATGTRSRS